ncbi:hypothetical protein [Tsukamurella soli]|uniref:hypothetical protein n=1 Tax=Tsukamurella soli TaxID=644556 RepID=UPI0031F1ABFC
MHDADHAMVDAPIQLWCEPPLVDSRDEVLFAENAVAFAVRLVGLAASDSEVLEAAVITTTQVVGYRPVHRARTESGEMTIGSVSSPFGPLISISHFGFHQIGGSDSICTQVTVTGRGEATAVPHHLTAIRPYST